MQEMLGSSKVGSCGVYTPIAGGQGASRMLRGLTLRMKQISSTFRYIQNIHYDK